MKAVDTNILARLIIRDSPEQLEIASQLIRDDVFVPLTVILELGWLLLSRYGLSRVEFCRALNGLVEHPRIHLQDEANVAQAVGLYAEGADFADAIHLVAARGAESFVTFDRDVPDGTAIGVPVEVVGR